MLRLHSYCRSVIYSEGFRFFYNSSDRPHASVTVCLRYGEMTIALGRGHLPRVLAHCCMCYYLSSVNAIWGIEFACASIAVPACASTWFLVILAISVATSTSDRRDSAAIRFSA